MTEFFNLKLCAIGGIFSPLPCWFSLIDSKIVKPAILQ